MIWLPRRKVQAIHHIIMIQLIIRLRLLQMDIQGLLLQKHSLMMWKKQLRHMLQKMAYRFILEFDLTENLGSDLIRILMQKDEKFIQNIQMILIVLKKAQW